MRVQMNEKEGSQCINGSKRMHFNFSWMGDFYDTKKPHY